MAARRRWRWAAIGGVAAVALIGALARFRFARAREAAALPEVTPGFVVSPYLQALGATSVTVKLELPAPAPAEVQITRAGDPAPSLVVKSEGARAFHALRASGLAPATAYNYVVSAGGARSERGRFTTAPTDARPIRFLVYGDSRSDPAAHAAVVRAMTAAPSDFLINTGDMVARGNEPEDWRAFFAVEAPLIRDRCLFAAVGNHELYLGSKDGEVAFLRYFAGAEGGQELTRLYGSFRWGSARFFVLNAMDGWTGPERAWLRGELDRALNEPGLTHRFAVLHWGPFSAGKHGDNPALREGDVIAMMRDRKVDLVLAGHDHTYERGTGHGLKYVVSGGGGAPLYPSRRATREAAVFEAAYHFVEVAVDGDRVTTIARRVDGGVIDRCGFTGAGGWDCDKP